MLALLATAALMGPCASETPPALQLTGIPSVAIPGKSYTAMLDGDGAVVDSAGSDIGVKDATGRGWNAHYQFARGVTQAFSVGLRHPPFTVTASWTEPGPCLRTVTVPLLWPGLIAAWLLLFVASIRELGASILLMGPHSKVITPAIVESWFASSTELTAAMALIQTLVVAIAVSVLLAVTRRATTRITD